VILIVTNGRDLTSDFVVLELQRRGLPYFRLNTETLPAARVRFGGGSLDWSLETAHRSLVGQDVRAAYFRRPGPPSPDEDLQGGHRDYCVAEWNALLKSLYTRLDGLWLNAPWAILRAEDKPHQLQRAAKLGFDIPATVITNDLATAVALAQQAPSIVKPLRKALVEGKAEQVVFTSRWDAFSPVDERAMAAAPIIVQHEVPKQADIRVTVVGDQLFPVAIDSQATAETEVDWRKGSDPNLAHGLVTLPDDVAERCRALVRGLDLKFGAIDLILGQDGKYWFLEINPNGQWAWIQQRTGAPIAEAIVDALLEIAG